MVKWKDSWLEAEESNGVRLNLWLRKDDEYHGYCKLCRCQVKYNTQGAQAFTQHSQKKKHKDISDIRFFQFHRCIFQEKQNHQHPQK